MHSRSSCRCSVHNRLARRREELASRFQSADEARSYSLQTAIDAYGLLDGSVVVEPVAYQQQSLSVKCRVTKCATHTLQQIDIIKLKSLETGLDGIKYVLCRRCPVSS